MKKIAILSMQKVNNFGSLLQGYALKKMVENFGHTVNFIDIKKIDEDNILLSNTTDYRIETQLYLSKLKKIDKYIFNRFLIKYINKKQNKEFEVFRNKILKIDEKNNNKKYDLCIIGSDEVFNCTSPGEWGFTSQLFGNVDNCDKVITYAASCGPTKYEFLNEKMKKRISESLNKIDEISVRDENTKNFVSQLSKKKININLDPVLIANFDQEISENSKLKLPKKYCIVYSYYNRINDKKEINEIKKLCKKHKIKIISIGAPQFWISKHLKLNPFELLYAFSKAEFVITDTFHGTIFASKYSKKFSIIIRKSNNNKLLDLVERLKINEHLCNDITDIENIYKINKNSEKINNIIKKEIENTNKYLERNLKNI